MKFNTGSPARRASVSICAHSLRALAVVALLATAVPAFGQSTTWTGATSSAWGILGNWSNGVPTATKDAFIPAGTPHSPTTSGATTPQCGALTVAAGAQLTVVAATPLAVNGDLDLSGTILGGGTLRVVGAAIDSTLFGTGTHTVSFEVAKVAPHFMNLAANITFNGNLTVTSGVFRVAFGFVTMTVNGNAQLSGGSLTTANQGTLDVNGNVTFNGTSVVGSCPNISCSGNFVADAAVQATSGSLTMDGAGTRTIAAPGASLPGLVVSPGTTVTTTTSPLTISGFAVSGAFSTTGVIDVNGPFSVAATGSATSTGGGTHTVSGDVSCDGTLALTGTVRLDGTTDAYLSGLSSSFPTIEVAKAPTNLVNLVDNCTATGLTVTAGTLIVSSGFHTLTVNGNAAFNGGTLTVYNQGTIDANGNVTFAGTTVAGVCPNIFCAGNFTANAAFQATYGTLTMDGPGTHTVSAPGATLPLLAIAAGSTVTSTTPALATLGLTANGSFSTTGTIAMNGPFSVGATGSVTTTGGGTHSVTGDVACAGTLAMSGTLRFTGTNLTSLANTSTLPAIEVAKVAPASVVVNGTARATSLIVTSGTLIVSAGFYTLTVTGNAAFNGGTLTIYNQGTIDVNGNVTFAGTTVAGPCPNMFCGGNLAANAALQATSGTLTMDGPGTHTVSTTGATLPLLAIAAGSTVTSTTPALATLGLAANGSFSTTGTIAMNGPFSVGAAGSVTTTGGGTHSVTGDVACAGTLAMTGTLQFTGTSPTSFANTSSLPVIEVAKAAAATVDVNGTATATGLIVTSGTLRVSSGFYTLTINGNAAFNGGALGVYNVGTIDVNGNITFAGTAVTGPCPHLFCAGNLVANAAVQTTSGTLTMDGPGTHTITTTGAVLPAITIAAGTTITTSSPVLGSLGLTVNGTFSSTGVLHLNGPLGEGPAGSITTTGGGVHTVSGDVACGGALAMTGTVRLDGSNGASLANTSTLPTVEVAKSGGAIVDVNGNATSTGLVLTSGVLRLTSGFFTMTVNGNATFNGGVLGVYNVGALDVNGNLTFAGTSVTGTMPIISCAGNLVMNSNVQVGYGTLTMDGPGAHTITAPGATMPVIAVAAGTNVTTTTSPFVALGLTANGGFSTSGVLDINGDVSVGAAGSIATTGGGNHTVAGGFVCGGTLAMTGTLTFDGNLPGGFASTSPLPPLIVAKAAGVPLDLVGDATCQALTESSGLLRVSVGVFTLTVNGNATFNGGAFSAYNIGVLDVNGNVTFAGTTVNGSLPTVRCAGNFLADAAFTPTFGTLELDGATPTTFGPSVPGAALPISTLVVKNGVRSPNGAMTLRAANVDVQAGGTLSVTGGRLAINSLTSPTTFTVSGAVSVPANGELALGPQVGMNVAPSGILTLQGTPQFLARLTGEAGGGYALSIDGTISAKNFLVKDAGPGGLLINSGATIAAPPNDLRGGTFDFRAGASPGSVLLDVWRPAATNIRYTTFLNTPVATGVFNARTTGFSAPISFTNFGGAWSGPGFENDPSNKINWNAPEHTTLTQFRVQPGAELATIQWFTSAEYDIANYIVERATNPGGPFVQVLSQPPGVGAYGFSDMPLLANTTYYYRLSERLTHDVINVLANGSTVPYSSGPPANVFKVGGGGPFATIQAAVTAATGADAIVWVTAGTYGPFTIGPGGPANLRVVADPGTTVSTTTGAVQITGITAGRVVELDGMTIGTTSTANDGVVITNCSGTIVLDTLDTRAGATRASVRVTNSTAVSIQGCTMNGSPGLVAATNSVVAASRGSLNSVVATTSALQFCNLVPGSQTITPPSTLTTFAGIMPQLTLPRLAHLGTQYTLSCDAFANGPVLVAAATNATYVASIGAGFEMPFMLDPASIVFLPPLAADPAGHLAVGFDLEPNAALLGLTFRVQALCQNPLTGLFRFTNLETMTGMP